MVAGVVKVAALAVSSTVLLPYVAALMCNLAYGWPNIRNKYRRAFNPKKVYALNLSIIQSMMTSLRFAALYFQWKAYYKTAPASEIMKDRTYGCRNQKLDLYFPRSRQGDEDDQLPVIMFAYGGAWGSGNKKMYGLLCSAIANRLGVIVCCANHSTYPKGHVDDMVQDMVECLDWLRENVEHYNGDKNNIILLGHSSGAHLCALTMLEIFYGTERRGSAARLSTSPLYFRDRHFAFSQLTQLAGENSDSENNVDRHSSGSSNSFQVIDDSNSNGEYARSISSEYVDVTSSVSQISGTIDTPGMSKTEEELIEQSAADNQGTITAGSQPSVAAGSQPSVTAGSQPLVTAGSQPSVTAGSQPPVTAGSQPSETAGNQTRDVGENVESGDESDESVVTVKEGDLLTAMEPHPSLVALRNSVKAVIGLAGVYHIGDHFKHESSRGVEDISAMTRAMYGPEHFDRFSPTHIVSTFTKPVRLPKIVIVHGTEDYVVPISSANRFVDELKQADADVRLRIIPSCDHYEICLDLMKPSRYFHSTVMAIIEDTAKEAFV